MFPFDGKYLKVLSIRTIDGVVPKIDDDTNMAEYKETHLPLSAQKYIDIQNETLPKHLRKKYSIVDSDVEKIDSEGAKMIGKKTAPPALKPKDKTENKKAETKKTDTKKTENKKETVEVGGESDELTN